MHGKKRPTLTLLQQASLRFTLDTQPPVDTIIPVPERINIDDHLKPALRKLWQSNIADRTHLEEWIETLYKIFGIPGDHAQTCIMQTDYKKFVNFTLQLQNLIQFMATQMPTQKEELIQNLIAYFRNHCLNVYNLKYNHAANVCDTIGLFYGATPALERTSPLLTIIPEYHSTISDREFRHKLALMILGKLQNNIPGEETDALRNAHEYTAIQTRLLECILLRLSVIGIKTQAGVAHQEIEQQLPDEIKLFLDKLPNFAETDTRTPTTISLWLSHYNPIESIGDYLKRKALITSWPSNTEEQALTTSEFLIRIEQAIKSNDLRNIQAHQSAAERAETEEGHSPLQALFEINEWTKQQSMTESRASDASPIAIATSASAATAEQDHDGIELRVFANAQPDPQTPEQHEIQEYTQICRIIPSVKIKPFYKQLLSRKQDQAALFLKAQLHLQGIEALDAIKSAYPKIDREDKKSFYHPQLALILTAWKNHARKMVTLPKLLGIQKQKWIAEGKDANTIFQDLAQLIVENLILPEELVAHNILSRDEYNAYTRLLNFDSLTPSSIRPGRLSDNEPMLLQNDIACLIANPALWTNMHAIITTLAGDDGLPTHNNLKSAFAAHESRIFPTENSPTQRFKGKQLPPPGNALEELFKNLHINALIIESQDDIGRKLEEAFEPYLVDTYPDQGERIAVVRAYIQYLLNHPAFTHQEWTRPEREAQRRSTPDDETTIRPATAADFDHRPDTIAIIKSGLNKLLTHLRDSLDVYATKTSTRRKWLARGRTGIFALAFIGAILAEVASYLRVNNDPSGSDMDPIKYNALNDGSYVGAVIIGAWLMKAPYMLTPKRLHRMQMQEILSALEGKRPPYRAAMLTLSAVAMVLAAAAGSADAYIIHALLRPLDAESHTSTDDAPASKEIDKIAPIGNYLLMAALFMAGISVVSTYYAVKMGIQNDWFSCKRARAEIIAGDHIDYDQDRATPRFRPAQAPRTNTRTPLLEASAASSYGTTFRGVVRAGQNTYATAMSERLDATNNTDDLEESFGTI